MAELDLPYKPVTTAEFEVILVEYNAKAFQSVRFVFSLFVIASELFLKKNTPMFDFTVILTYFT